MGGSETWLRVTVENCCWWSLRHTPRSGHFALGTLLVRPLLESPPGCSGSLIPASCTLESILRRNPQKPFPVTEHTRCILFFVT